MLSSVQMWVLILICALSAFAVQGLSINADKIQSQDSDSSLMVSSRISGGTTPDRNDLRFVAKLQITFRSRSTLVCSGVVLTEKIILTVAHCVIRVGQIRASSVVATLPQGRSYTFNQNEIIIHPDYNYLYGTDIALLRKSNQLSMTNYGRPPSIPVQRDVPTKPTVPEAFLAGWGLRRGSDDYSPTLQVGSVRIMMDDDCENIYYPQLYNSMQEMELLCTENISFAGLCDGDWGGPLLQRNSFGDRYTLLGLSIFTESNCNDVNRKPNAFMYVEMVGNWLRNQIPELN